MTQSSMQIGNVEAAAARTALNTALEALATLSTGATAPTATFANQLWYDTTAGVLKKRTPANDGWETLITALGLKAMAELAIATQVEAEAGTATDKGMTPLRTAQAIAALSPAPPVKAWVNFDGSTTPPTIRAGLNVASVARNAVGDYTITFDSAFADANYAAFAIAQSAFGFNSTGHFSIVTQATTTLRIQGGVSSAYIAGDRAIVNVIVCR